MARRQIDSLKAKAALLGLDVEALVNEIVEEAAKKQLTSTLDEDALVERVTTQVEERLAAKLAEVLEVVKASSSEKVDTKGIIQGVVELLNPTLAQVSKKAAEETFQANSQALITQMVTELKARQVQSSAASGDGAAPTPASGLGSMNMMELVQYAVANSKGIAELVQAFKPAKSVDQQIGDRILDIFKWTRALDKMRNTQSSIEDIEKSIAEIVAKPKT